MPHSTMNQPTCPTVKCVFDFEELARINITVTVLFCCLVFKVSRSRKVSVLFALSNFNDDVVNQGNCFGKQIALHLSGAKDRTRKTYKLFKVRYFKVILLHCNELRSLEGHNEILNAIAAIDLPQVYFVICNIDEIDLGQVYGS